MFNMVELMNNFNKTYEEIEPYQFSRDYFIEIFYYGPELMRYADGFNKLIKLLEADSVQQELIDEEIAKQKKRAVGYFKNYDVDIDRQLASEMLKKYFDMLDPLLVPEIKEEIDKDYDGDLKAYADKLFAKSLFADQAKIEAWLAKPKVKKLKTTPH